MHAPHAPHLLGRTVIVMGHESNGAAEHPAIVTRDWGGGADLNRPMVNVTILPDCGTPRAQGSIYHQDDPRASGVAWRFPDEPRGWPRG